MRTSSGIQAKGSGFFCSATRSFIRMERVKESAIPAPQNNVLIAASTTSQQCRPSQLWKYGLGVNEVLAVLLDGSSEWVGVLPGCLSPHKAVDEEEEQAEQLASLQGEAEAQTPKRQPQSDSKQPAEEGKPRTDAEARRKADAEGSRRRPRL